MKRVEDLRPGDLIDLEGDEYADPTRDEGLPFAYELSLVAGIEIETPYCARVDIEGVDSFGFPIGHLVNVDGRMEGFNDEDV